MADGAIITDGSGLVRLINPAAARLLGVTEPEALGRSFAQVVRHHRLIDLWQRSREGGQVLEETVEMHRQDVFLRAIVTPLDEEGAEGTLTILQDLTRVRRLETVRRDFISNISHELRTPLASLKALVETLRDGAMDDPKAAGRFLNRVETEVDALTQMVQELLELSRVESGQVPLNLVRTDVSELFTRTAERLRPQAERAGLTLSVSLPPDVPRVLADAERMQQVVVNLLHNAIKFTPPGGQVAISAESAGTEVIVSVRDTGVGIAAENLERIFERFYKADRARSGGGTGLGLAIAKHIVQAHGGRIWAESVEGKGSVFRFALPVADSQQS
jgi:two-component system phosphate regulon sensor histidine kinase PhoR